MFKPRNIVSRKRLVTRPPAPEIRRKLFQRASLRRRLLRCGLRAQPRSARNQNQHSQKAAADYNCKISLGRAHTPLHASPNAHTMNRHEHPSKAVILADRRAHLVPLGLALEHPRRRNYRVIVERPPDELHSERQLVLAQSAWHADRRQSTQTGNSVRRAPLDWPRRIIFGRRAQWRRRRRFARRCQYVEALEQFVYLRLQKSPHALHLQIIPHG